METGQIIAGKYEVLQVVGRGGMGTVYRAFQRNLGRVVAIKMLAEELASDPEFRARFQQEATLVARLNHPNIVSVYDIEEHKSTFCIIMEFLDGESLQAKVDREGQLAPDFVVDVGIHIARALHHAHQHGVIHRDIKPDNIHITSKGVPKVMDFGIARFIDSKLKTQTGISMGTPKYMSPEQVTGKNIDGQTDLYSLGICLYTALAGRVPFDGDNPIAIATKHLYEQPPAISQFNPDVPLTLERAVMKALEKSKALRYGTGVEMSDALEAAVSPLGSTLRIGEIEAVPTTGATQKMASASAGARFAQPSPLETTPMEAMTPVNPSRPVPEFEPDLTPAEPARPMIPTPATAPSPARRPTLLWGAVGLVAVLLVGVGLSLGLTRIIPPAKSKGAQQQVDPAKAADKQIALISEASNRLAGEKKFREARDLWTSFAQKNPTARPDFVNGKIDELTAQLPVKDTNVPLVAERREAKGKLYLNGPIRNLSLARAYLEGAQALNNEPYKYTPQINLLAHRLDKERGAVAAADAARAKELAGKAGSDSATTGTDELIQAIDADPWQFDYWITLAERYQKRGLADDARVLLNYVDRNTSAGTTQRQRSSQLLSQLNEGK